MPRSKKSFELTDLPDWLTEIRRSGKTIAHCHGVFDLLHPGHIVHLKEAGSLADVLIVTITSDRFVNKGPGRPVLSADRRVAMLEALEIVDAVAISDFANGLEAIKVIQPDFYVKGPDYKNPSEDLTGNMQREIDAVTAVGGKIHLTTGETMSSSQIANSLLTSENSEQATFLKYLRKSISPHDIEFTFQEIGKLNVLVIGETIIDTYIKCEALGKSSKDPVLAFRPMEVESQLGGVLAIAKHLAGLGAKTSLLTRVGSSDRWADLIRRDISGTVDLHLLETFDEPTIEKTRYVDSITGNKVFETYQISDSGSSERDASAFNDYLANLIEGFDLVVVADYGHGLINRDGVQILTERAKVLAVNTQSNAGNRGFNTISKYPRLDLLCLNGGEVALELRERHLELEVLVPDLLNRTGARFAAVTSGSKGVIVAQKIDNSHEVISVPAFASRVQDRVGAGDALFAAISLCVTAGGKPILSGLLGNLAGAASIADLGNRVILDKVSLIRHAQALLK